MSRSIMLSTGFSRGLNTSATTTTYPSVDAVSSRPSGAGVIENPGRSNLVVFPFGRDAANENFHMKILAWPKASDLWFVHELALLTVTLGTYTGIQGKLVGVNDLFADTIVVSRAATAYTLGSPGLGIPTNIDISVGSFELIQFVFDIDAGGTPVTEANCLYGWN